MISVVMPIYNAERYLGEALDSLLAQTRPADEILLIEDGSADATLAIAEGYARRHAAITVHADGQNKGTAKRLNEGLALARHPFIARMDGDDVCEPHRFERQLARMEAEPDLVLLGTRVLVIDPDGAPLNSPVIPLDHAPLDGALLEGQGQLMFHPSVMMRADALARVGGYPERHRYVQDLDLFLRLAETGRIANMDEALLRYRHHFSSTGYDKIPEQEAAIADYLAAARRRRGLPEPDEPTQLRRSTQSRGDTHRTWGWWALGDGHLTSARKHALNALRHEPTSAETLRLVYCAVRDSIRPN